MKKLWLPGVVFMKFIKEPSKLVWCSVGGVEQVVFARVCCKVRCICIKLSGGGTLSVWGINS